MKIPNPASPAVVTIGVDGCPSGWVCALRRDDCVEIAVVASFAEIVRAWPDAVIAIDVPIGLPVVGSRTCDDLARARLGPRRASVFPAPLRCCLRAHSQAEASRLQRAADGRGVSAQTWNIIAKIREVDAYMDRERQQRIVEVHPELTFAAMADDTPMTFSKKTVAGRLERERMLEKSVPLVATALSMTRVAGARRDDVLDALAALWTADRLAAGSACRVPVEPAVDERGLRMEMCF